jgi:uncharacterized membrane protein YcaP (DUF421 family)
MLSLAIPAWQIVLRTAVVYLIVLAGMRLAGKREMGQMTTFDLVLLLLIANAVQNAMVGPDTSLSGGLLAALVLLLLNALIAQLRLRWPQLRHVIEGSPTLLVLHGTVIEEHLRREGLDLETVQAACREHGIADVGKVEMAILEIDGSISIVLTDEHTKHVRRKVKTIHHS